MSVLTIKDVVKKIGAPAKLWKGNCYAVSCDIVKAGLVPESARAVYGHYLGPVAKGTMFDKGQPFVRHGWIKLEDGSIIDPTRWVFEGVEPYIYHLAPAEGMKSCQEYDEGGEGYRTRTCRAKPAFDPEDTQYDIDEDYRMPLTAILQLEPERETMSQQEVLWIANLPVMLMGTLAYPILAMLKNMQLTAFMPIDNLRRIEAGDV